MPGSTVLSVVGSLLRWLPQLFLFCSHLHDSAASICFCLSHAVVKQSYKLEFS